MRRGVSLVVAALVVGAGVGVGVWVGRRRESFGARSTDDDTLDRTFFWTRHETANFLHSDPGWYVNSLSDLDLQARRAPSRHAYRRRAAAAAADFTPEQRKALRAAAVRADAFFQSKAFCRLDAPIVAVDLVALPWVFALTRDDAYEDGIPHTRFNTIFLSTHVSFREPDLTRLLIHEKIHIYQRSFAEVVERGLHARGWRTADPVPPKLLRRRRANPDRPERVLRDRDGRVHIAMYHPAPTRIAHADASREDPYEEMAYRLAAAYRG